MISKPTLKKKNEEVESLVTMLQQDIDSQFEETNQRAKELFLSLIGLIEQSNSSHLEALHHLMKAGTALKSTFETLKKSVPQVLAIEPSFKGGNKNIDKQRKFFATSKRRKKGNIRFTKPSD